MRENPDQDHSTLSRDASNALNELGRIFDKKKIEEQQELSSVFGEEAFKLAHKLPNDGKGTKILVHAAIGGIMSSITGAGFASGAAGAGLNEAVIKEIAKIHDPGTAQIVSAIVGAAAAKAVGGTAGAGASAAASGTKWNYFLIEHPESFAFDKLAQKTLKRKDGKELSEDEVLKLLQGVSDIFAEHEPVLSDAWNGQSENIKNYKYVVQYLMNQGITGESANDFLMSYNTYLREQIDWNVTQDAIGYFDASDNYVFKRSYKQWIQAYRPQKFWGIDLKTMELVEPPVGDKDNDGSNVKPKGTPPQKATESIHNILDAAGFIPRIGTPAGLIDAGIYTFIDGDYTSGFITAATSIPGLKQAKGVASIVKRTMPILTKADKIAKESKLLTSAGKFREKELEEGYLIYVARKEKQGAPPRDRIDWKEARDYFLKDSPMARGNRFNHTARDGQWYPYNEVHLENEKRLDSYNPEKGEIVSRKATDLEMIDMKTFDPICGS